MSELGPLEANTIVEGDCLEVMSKMMPDECIDMALTAPPPCDVSRGYDVYLLAMGRRLAMLRRILKPGRRLVWIVASQEQENYSDGLLPSPYDAVQLARQAGLVLREEILWDDPIGTDKWPTGSYPFGPSVLVRHAVSHLMVFQKPAAAKIQHPPLGDELKKFNVMDRGFFRDRVSKQVWSIPLCKDSGDTPFPETLAEPCIRMWSRPGDIIFDPYTRSGVTAITAVTWHRRYFGCEENPDYHKLAEHLIGERRMIVSSEQMLED